jgi:transcriptional activator protein UGA3
VPWHSLRELTVQALLPMAMESAPLRDCLVAFAAGHLSLTDQSYKLPALEARCKALSSLSRSVNTLSNDIGHHEANAAACLTFVICDVGVDAGEAWINHLSAAQHIIMTAKAVSSAGKVLEGPDAFKTTSEGEWILRNFAYHDIIGCMTTRKRPLLGAAYLNDIADVVDSYVGVATDLLILAAEIGRIEDETQTKHDATPQDVQENIATFHKRCADLQNQLQDWKCQEGTPTELAAVAYAYRSAILIVLYRLVRSRLRSGYFASVSDARSDSRATRSIQDKIETHVEETLNHVAKVPLGSMPESPLLFPLFIAGGEALQPAQMKTVRNRLKHTLGQRRFLNIATALEVLEELWRRRGREEPELDWSDIHDRSGKQLLLT